MQYWVVEPVSALNSPPRRGGHLNAERYIGVAWCLGCSTRSHQPSFADTALERLSRPLHVMIQKCRGLTQPKPRHSTTPFIEVG
jgi:hypothetical protein